MKSVPALLGTRRLSDLDFNFWLIFLVGAALITAIVVATGHPADMPKTLAVSKQAMTPLKTTVAVNQDVVGATPLPVNDSSKQ